MILSKNFKVENGGIWISKEEIQSWRDHYESVADSCELLSRKMYYKGNACELLSRKMYYKGKADVLIDLLKTIEREKED